MLMVFQNACSQFYFYLPIKLSWPSSLTLCAVVIGLLQSGGVDFSGNSKESQCNPFWLVKSALVSSKCQLHTGFNMRPLISQQMGTQNEEKPDTIRTPSQIQANKQKLRNQQNRQNEYWMFGSIFWTALNPEV